MLVEIRTGEVVKFREDFEGFKKGKYAILVKERYDSDKKCNMYTLEDGNGTVSGEICGQYDLQKIVSTNKDPVEELVKYVSNCVNYSIDNKKFAERFGREHRTLQQSFTRLCMEWVRYLAKQENYDARNEASVKLAKGLVDYMWNCDSSLPLI